MKTMNEAVNELMLLVEPMKIPDSQKHAIYAKAWEICSATINETQNLVKDILNKQHSKTKEE